MYEMNLPGVRIDRSLEEKSKAVDSNAWCLMGSCKNGLVISLSARIVENEKR